ncbi:MAG: hydantoinase B/oxoprolinase family protein [Dehalococcoidia bacterium]
MTVGPVDLEILWTRLIALADECWTLTHRAAFSPIISEALDLGCELMDAEGSTLAHATRGIPVFNLVLPNVVRHLRATETFAPGDVWITNDPWLCAGHLPDIAVITPVFHRDRLVAFVGNIANATDIGGGLNRAAAREVYEEGLFIPPSRLYAGGTFNREIARFIMANVREPEVVIADLEAQAGANEAAAAGLIRMLDEYGLPDVEAISRQIQDRSEAAMRRAIAATPDGVYESETETDGADEPIRLRGRVTVAGDRLTVAFPDCPPQAPVGGINSVLNYTRAHVNYALKCILAPGIASNEGCYRPIALEVASGTMLNATHPASVGLRAKTGWHVHSLVFSALAQALPNDVLAGIGFPSWIVISGQSRDGRAFREHLIVSGGLGATGAGDGMSAAGFPSSAASVPVEVIEARSPVLIEAKELAGGSGGDGAFRGGLGQRVRFRALPGEARQLLISSSLDRTRIPAEGLLGGAPGAPSRMTVVSPDGERDAADGYALLGPDDEAVVLVSGGGGFGDPATRPSALRERDHRLGYLDR